MWLPMSERSPCLGCLWQAAADALGLEPGQACGSVSPTREMLGRFIQTHFPVLRETAKNAGACAHAPPGCPALPHFLCRVAGLLVWRTDSVPHCLAQIISEHLRLPASTFLGLVAGCPG